MVVTVTVDDVAAATPVTVTKPVLDIATLPFDPEGGHFDDCNDYDTKYRIYKGDDNRLTVEAPNAQGDEDIKVTR
mgnify:CR=1 FL=1